MDRNYIRNIFLLLSPNICFLLILTSALVGNCQNFTSSKIGNAIDLVTFPFGGVCLMGGASENDQAMRWFLTQANGGDVVVLRASGGNGYNSYLYAQLGVNVNSVETLVIPTSAGANDSYVVQQVLNAEAIWIAGGNQATYVGQWKNTALDSALQSVIAQKKSVIGGTSAGMAILGQAYFPAINGSITSNTALSNPFNSSIVLGWNDFINHPLLQNTITDTHFDNPDRRGRLAVFMSRLLDTAQGTIRAIACDEYTAVCIDTLGLARVFGEWPQEDDNAYFVQVNCQLPNHPEVMQSGQPLTWHRNSEALKVCVFKGDTAGSVSFNTNDWITNNGGIWRHWSISNGVLNDQSGTPAQLCSVQSIHDEYISSQNILLWYPNPLNPTDFKIPEAWAFKTYRIKVYNLLGRQILESNALPGDQIMTGKISSGMYLMTVSSDSETTSHFKILFE